MSEIQVCTRCVMDTTDPDISFDADGVCDHCLTFDRKIIPLWSNLLADPHSLDNLVGSIKSTSTDNDFDCLIGLSGGIDSSYLVHLVHQLGLRPLLFHVDAGWNSDIAVSNIERLVDKLGFDLYTEVINWEEMRDLQLSFFKSGVPHIDTPQDHAFFATMYKFARKYNVKHILTGANYSTECIRNPLQWMYYQSDLVQLLDIHRSHGSVPLKTFPLTSILTHKIYLPYVKKIKVHSPLNLVPYNKHEAASILQSEYGWKPYPQKHFESRFTRFYEGFWLPKRFGYDTRKVQLSSLILTGQISRTDALRILSTPPLCDDQARIEIKYIASKLRISRDELLSYLDLPKKTHKDYQSQAWIYSLGAKFLRLIGSEVGGKR